MLMLMWQKALLEKYDFKNSKVKFQVTWRAKA